MRASGQPLRASHPNQGAPVRNASAIERREGRGSVSASETADLPPDRRRRFSPPPMAESAFPKQRVLSVGAEQGHGAPLSWRGSLCCIVAVSLTLWGIVLGALHVLWGVL